MATKNWFRQRLALAEKTFDFRLESILIEVAENLALFMKEQNLTRSQLADRLGVSPPYITKILNGNPNLTIKTMLKLADALNQDLEINFKTKQKIRAQQRALLPNTCLVSSEDLHEDLLGPIAESSFGAVQSKSDTQNFGFALKGPLNDCNLAA